MNIPKLIHVKQLSCLSQAKKILTQAELDLILTPSNTLANLRNVSLLLGDRI